MAVAGVVDARVNPNDSDQRIILWGNGRIDVRNGAAITDGPQDWFTRADQPVAVAIWVTNWSTTPWQGYILDKQGAFHPFGGAATMGTQRPEWPSGTDAGEVAGVPYWYDGIYVDWSWDPNTPGRGVVLDGYGTLHPFGGAPTPPRTLNRWVNPSIAARLEMQWSPSVRAYTLDRFGGIHADYAAVTVPSSAGAPYWPGQQVARHFAITNWTSPAAGYTLDFWGGVHQWGGAEAARGGPYQPGGDWARVLKVLNPDDPLRLWQVWAGGQEFEWVASTPPVVTAGGVALVSPPSTVTGTTRPMLSWDYSDPQRDSQAAFEWMVFTAAFVAAHTMTDPFVHWESAVTGGNGVDPSVRGVGCPIDLANGGYRFYVRAQDTAGQWSAWSSRAWTQAVPLPATPTGLTATANNATYSVDLSVSATTGGSATLVRFEYSDDGVTWAPVRGADAVPLTATTTATDKDAPLGVARSYRAVAYSIDPRVASLPSGTATATITSRHYVITAVDDAAAGGRLWVQEPVSWTRPFVAGVFEGLGAEYPTVVKDGSGPKAARGTVRLVSLDEAGWAKIESLADSGSTLVYRDPFGTVRYCEIVGDWPQTLMPKAALEYRHTTELPLIEVAPPIVAV